ncbi:PAS domain-containing protein [Lyngbya confervoides]|uniref:histidine kinase n=1 Tax=Lyngbya confervoides BDU141951 TaxID=1574623 RepID=A0ABD4T8G3_9CYAN|nr:PAS domain-containing protein [Lyngbya confervoides]MCM1984916.1 PAS domain-containing protein [Lyngbya confervoides BDU141951]
MDPQPLELQRLNALLSEKLRKLEQAEAALRESQERYTLAVQGSQDGIWDWNVLTNEVYYSPRCKAILGYQDHELDTQFSVFESRLHPADRDRILAALTAHLEQGVPYAVEYRLRAKGGDYRWIYARGQAIWDAQGQPTRMAGSISDITERKQVEEALRASEARWQFALEGAGEGVWDWNLQTQEVFFSHQWKAMLGYGDPEIGPHRWEWEKRIHPADREQCHAALNRHLQGESALYQNEHRVRCKDGSYKWILNRGQVVERDDQGRPLRMIGTHTDITERHEAEEALRQVNEQLESKVRERTRALEERAQDLERSNAELEQFAYVASHDLQEPLRTISSFTELLALEYRDRLGSEANEYIEFIVDGAARMQQLIKDLLTYSQVGRRGKAFQSISCTTVLQSVLESLSLAIAEGEAQVSYDPLPVVQADPSQLYQLFQNLIGNALKFRGQPPPQIHIGVQRYPSEWQFYVRDNGIGISPEYFDQIFVIFQRLHRRQTYEGTGIGLAICRKIVQRHGGRIWVDSTPDQGACFYFTLPVDPSVYTPQPAS